MQHYVGLRPMFDVEVMNEDSRLVLGDPDSTPNHEDVNIALSERYKQIIGMDFFNFFFGKMLVSHIETVISVKQILSEKNQTPSGLYSLAPMMSCQYWFRYLKC